MARFSPTWASTTNHVLGYAASTWISQPITAVLYHAEAGNAAYQQSFYGAIAIAAVAVVLTVYMMVSDKKKQAA